MKVPVNSKTVINVPGWSVIVAALVVDNMITNIIKLKAVQLIAEIKKEDEEEIS